MRVRGSAGIVVALCCAAMAVLAPSAGASPTSGPTTAVAIGDSYISGEAGRWAGNSVSVTPGNDGTDRACQPAGPTCTVDKTRVYLGGTENAGCHRSDVAEILSASLPVAERDNISCSGAVTRNVFRAASGGVGQNGEQPQADQLLPIARAKRVKLIMVSIGGNDLGFASIVAACLQAYVAQTGPCQPSQQQKLDAAKAKAQADVGKALDEIRAVMTEAGYSNDDYRLILQTYPSVAPRASEGRYPGQERIANGCPFYDQDANWARDSAAPQIGAVGKAAAAPRGVEVLDLIDAFQGHEFCSKTTRQSTPLDRPPAAQAEWGRFVGASTIQQGELQEAFHPNAYGQRALGTCVTKVFAAGPTGTFACAGAAGLDPSGLTLRRLSTFPPSSSGSVPTTLRCLAARSPIGARRVGRISLGVKRARLLVAPSLATVARPGIRTARYRYCVTGDSRHGVSAVFGGDTKIELLVSTSARYGNRGVTPGTSSRNFVRRYPHRRAAGSGVYRISPHGQRVVGIRHGKVKFVGVIANRVLKSKKALKADLKRAGV